MLKIGIKEMDRLEAQGLIRFERPSGVPSCAVEVAYLSTKSNPYYAHYQGKRWTVVYNFYDHCRYDLKEVSDGRD